MLPRYEGLVGEYLWEKEKARLERYKDRPWELMTQEASGDPLFVLLFVVISIMAVLGLLSLV